MIVYATFCHSADNHPGADVNPPGQFLQLLIGERYTPVSPVDGFMYFRVPLTETVDSQIPSQTGALGRWAPLVQLTPQGSILTDVDPLIYESPLCVVEIGVVNGHKQLETLAGPDMGDSEIAQGCGFVAPFPGQRGSIAANCNVVEDLKLGLALHDGKAQIVGVDGYPDVRRGICLCELDR